MSRAGTYAACVTQDNMEPRHHIGHWVLFEVDEAPIVGEDVFIEMVDGTRIVWRLDGIHEKEIEVSGYNPPASRCIPRSQVAALYPVMWSQLDQPK